MDRIARLSAELRAALLTLQIAKQFLAGSQAEAFETEMFRQLAEHRRLVGASSDQPEESYGYYIDELERHALLWRHRFDYREGDQSPDEPSVLFCLRCERFPIPNGSPCPSCGTGHFLVSRTI